jgi:hypothetical protein
VHEKNMWAEKGSFDMTTLNPAPQFESEFNTPEGQELIALISQLSDKMVEASEKGIPALEVVLPHLPLGLAATLADDDHLMTAFGHMARLEMARRGLTEKGSGKDCLWPKIRSVSHLSTFHRTTT